jgi:ADP-sugar diphosphatase
LQVEMLSLDGTPHAVPVTAEPGLELNKVLEYSVFQDWVASIDQDSRLFIENIHVQSLDMFGPRVGFIKFQSTAKVNVGGEKGLITVPGIVFMRGGAVGVLVILECEGQEFTILTNQARVPMGLHDLPEIPAGMLDGSGHFKGVAAEEIAEECNIVISEEELVDLTELACERATAMRVHVVEAAFPSADRAHCWSGLAASRLPSC